MNKEQLAVAKTDNGYELVVKLLKPLKMKLILSFT